MSVPPRWLTCPRKGKIIGGKFLPFKTPLSSRYDRDVPEDNKFDISMLISYVEAMQVRMGLVVDLTKTDRFYDKRTLTEVGIGHYKLKCEGFGEAPTAEQVEDFKRVCTHFFEQHPGEIVGVHCTHGYNRTGFLIISYLVEVEDWRYDPDYFQDEFVQRIFCKLVLKQQLQLFVKPPGIYKPEYLQVLADRLNGGSMAEISAPQRPSWCEEEDVKSPRHFSGNGHHKRSRDDLAHFVEGVTGPSSVGPPLREEIQQQCQYILAFHGSGFAGSQPVSMDVQNIKFLHEKPYRVSWKADGTRYIMYIRKESEIYMLDRNNAVFLVPNLEFLSRQTPGHHLKETLVDGEMVFDKAPNSPVRPRYLIYDIMQFEGSRDIAQCPHTTRLQCITKELIEPREAAARSGSLNKKSEPFGVRAKLFWDVKETRMILNKFIKELSHETDGLIFSPALEPYTPGQCNNLLKWKPSDLNSVDFRLSIVDKTQQGQLPEKIGHLYVGGYPQPFSTLDLKRNKEAKQHNGRIVECYWDKNVGWTFMRVREDKSFPNGLTTAKSVCQSICQPVTQNWLVDVVENHRWKPPDQGGVKRSSEHLPTMPPLKAPRTE